MRRIARKSTMFEFVGETWSPVTGCKHNCSYCWARRLARRFAKRWGYGFEPRFHPQRLSKSFGPNELVFVCDMGDLFGDWVPAEWIREVLATIACHPKTSFLLLTKNPKRYSEFELPSNAIAGVTIETNRDELVEPLSDAPKPSERYEAISKLEFPQKFISVEPILDFDLRVFFGWMESLSPALVGCAIGYDNYGYRLPEPPLEKTLRLIELKRELEVAVCEKTIRPAWYEPLRGWM